MSPARKARPVPPAAVGKRPLEAGQDAGTAQKDLAFLIVGGIALFEGIALILLARRKI